MLPDKQLLLDEVDGLSEIPDSTLESIATAGLIEFLQGSSINPSLPKQQLVTAANPLQCLKRQEVLGLFVRKLLDVLEVLDTAVYGGGLNELERFATLTDFRAAIVTAEEVTILSDRNGSHAKFYKDIASVVPDNGVTSIIDAAGTHFTRLQL